MLVKDVQICQRLCQHLAEIKTWPKMSLVGMQLPLGLEKLQVNSQVINRDL